MKQREDGFMKKLLYIILIVIFIGCGKESREVDIKRPLVAFGDSLTKGYGSPAGYTDYLAEYIRVDVINMGVSGDTTASALNRVDEVLEHNPGIVIIGLGANDFFRKIPVDETERNLKEITHRLKGSGRTLFIVKFYPKGGLISFFAGKKKKQYDKIYREISKREDIYIVEDVWKDVWKKEMSDNIHPNARGYELMGENYLRDLREVFGSKILKEK